jgi:outer membrane cobalamin receptor
LSWFPLTAFAADTLDEVTVTGTREGQLLSETPASVKVISGATLRQDKPSHPSQVLGQSPGVWVNVTGGEGHMTAIRQPLTTNPVYLYLEDGIPTRSTGFFNHNALYEINVPHAGGIEVTRGPGTALYGSDAIGGV